MRVDDDDAIFEAAAFDDDQGDAEPEPTRCLFSEQVFANPAECLAHAKAAYGLDLAAIAGTLALDFDGRLRLVNFVRSAAAKPGADPAAVVASVAAAAAAGPAAAPPWAADEYLVPALDDDPLLFSWCADAPDALADDGSDAPAAPEAAADVDALVEAMAQMRSEVAALVGALDEPAAAAAAEAAAEGEASSSAAGAAAAPAPAAAAEAEEEAGQYGRGGPASSSYFDSYAALQIHHDMLADAVRTEGYRDAIEGNAALLKDKVVLDVGCGTGILSMFCARAGARLVIGVDASEIIEHARKIVAANGLSEKVVLLRGTVETVALPAGVEKVDVIVSEWMGYALLYESMLPSVLFARDRHLAAGGAMLPSSCTMLVSASSHDKLAFWDDVYGFDYAHLADVDRKEASVELVPPETLLSAPAPFRVVDTTSAADAELDFTAPFELAATAEGTLRCFVVHFDTAFAPAGGVATSFTTAASATPTHWKQTALYLKRPLALRPGDAITGTVGCVRHSGYKRAYDFSVSFAVNGGETSAQLFTMR